ncbi:ABC transporter ATP-binding protein [Paenibacillus sp. 1011MAR3C5]|uniref:ribosomal protection-like ABC-F family protein n=1 Tax=Paenibacillus sp. 1011MAR3C5 TaxID=1675787 RepID=UPI000E6BCCE6|nr:ABC-F family ATP-binding cassette domain-containing protein [Paenibacillus sp. 1011MAR3C5]RJE88781.1 ABC transporter ATP-binding protein [Paenibacillus sp. 1011MAR3C5]
MLLVKVQQAAKDWDGEMLFKDVSFDIREGERLALFGRNGVGKTTLLHAITGRIALDEGQIQRLLSLEQWGWLDQQPGQAAHLSLMDTVLNSSCPERYQLKQELEACMNKMGAGVTDAEELERYSSLMERYTFDGYEWERRAELALRQLQLGPEHWAQPYASLSGGQKTKAQLAALLLKEPKLLLLDEPTNHLDSASLLWLEEWVVSYKGTIVYVSHDRMFIDRTATAVIELTKESAKRYEGGYSDYRRAKDVELRTIEAQHKKQELEREKLLESIRMYAQWFQQAHKAAGQNDFLRSKSKKNVSRLHAKESALQRLDAEGVQKPREAAQLYMRLESEAFEAAHVIRMEGISFAYSDSRPLLTQFNMNVSRGERVAIIGPNGAGKSTLAKLAIGSLKASEGAVIRHPHAKIGYFEQELSRMDAGQTLLDSLLDLPGMTQSHARTILACFLFRKEEVFKRIGDLSMGEKCRVAFLRLFFGKCNMLVLDEPTNYLDIDTRERVEEALRQYPGTVLLITHDRYLTKRLATSLVVMDGMSEPHVFAGTFDEYESSQRLRAMSAEQLQIQYERDKLKLRLTQLMGMEKLKSEEDDRSLMLEIRSVKLQLKQLGDSTDYAD